MAGSDFEGTSPKSFWPETLVYLLPGAELNQMLTLIVTMKSGMSCEPELLVFAGMNDHLHAAGLLEHLEGADAKEDLGGNPDAVCSIERSAGVGSFPIGIKNEGGFCIIARLCRHATSSAVPVCNVDPDSRKKRMANANGSAES